MAAIASPKPGDWLTPPGEKQGLRRYAQTVRERAMVVVATVVLVTGAATGYALTAEKVYEAEVDVLVAPVPEDSELLIGLGLPSSSVDPLRDVQTAARLMDTRTVAARTLDKLNLPSGPAQVDDLLERTSVEPVAESDVVAVMAEAPTAEEAADVANAFAQSAVDVRTEELHERIDAQLPALKERLGAITSGEVRNQLESDVAQLELLSTSDDPTLSLATKAAPPEEPVAPRPVLSIAAGLLAGLVLGMGAAFGLQALDPRVRREEQLREHYRLPILARVPQERSTKSGAPLTPESLSHQAMESYRTLRAMLGATIGGSDGQSRSVLVTGSAGGEGKTTTSLNLASSLALAGNRVILIEADLRRPSLGKALQREFGGAGVVSVLLGESSLEDALVDSPSLGSRLRVLRAEREGVELVELFSLPTSRAMVAGAKALADYVVIDSPPLTEVVDTMPLARMVDDVLIVVRLGRSRLDRITELGELLAENGIRPVGFATVGVARAGRDSSYYHRGIAESRSLLTDSAPSR